MGVANVVFLDNTVIKMTMVIKLSTVINTSAVFCHLLFILDYQRMTITLYGLDVYLPARKKVHHENMPI